MTREAMLYERLEDNIVHCFLCSHHCRIAPGRYGSCGVRQNTGGELVTHSYGKLVAEHADPIEKKPLFHFLPGSRSYSIAAAGCNFTCGFCQNWQISQKREADSLGVGAYSATPAQVAERAERADCGSISYTYTEPTVFFEFALDTARAARERGLRNVFVTNGFMTAEAYTAIQPFLDAANVDLKYYDDKSYRSVCGGRLQPVLDTIRRLYEGGTWVEVTTLLIPGQNDSEKDLEGIARFLSGIGAGIPWHLSAFHPDYKFTDCDYTPRALMEKALDIGKAAGLKYVYLGNIAAEENTFCANCGDILVRRYGMQVLENRLAEGACSGCRTVLEGIFVPSIT